MKASHITLALLLSFYADNACSEITYNSLASDLANSTKNDSSSSNINKIIEERESGQIDRENKHKCETDNTFCSVLLMGNNIISAEYSHAAENFNHINFKDLKENSPTFFYESLIKNFSNIDIAKLEKIPKPYLKNNRDNITLKYIDKSNEKNYIYPKISAMFNREHVDVVVDTGMPLSILTKEYADKIGLVPFKDISLDIGSSYSESKEKYSLAIVKSLFLNGLEIKNFPVWIGGKSNALGLDFISFFNTVKFTDKSLTLNSSPISESKKEIAIQNYSDLSGMINKKVAILEQDDKNELVQIDTGLPYFLIKSRDVESCATPLIYSGGDQVGNWNRIFCPEYTQIVTKNNKIEGVQRIMNFPFHILPNYVGAGFLSYFDLMIDNKNGNSGFYSK